MGPRGGLLGPPGRLLEGSWGGETVVEGLYKLYKAVWDTKHLPTPWRRGNIKFPHKHGATSPQEISNYRPICLISIIGKVFTRAWLPRLVKMIAHGASNSEFVTSNSDCTAGFTLPISSMSWRSSLPH